MVQQSLHGRLEKWCVARNWASRPLGIIPIQITTFFRAPYLSFLSTRYSSPDVNIELCVFGRPEVSTVQLFGDGPISRRGKALA